MLKRDRCALIVIDVQEKLFQVMHEKEALLDSMQRLIKGVKTLGLPIVWAEQYPKGMGTTLPELRLLLKGEALAKLSFSCCGDPGLAAAIARTGCTQFLLMGIETHVCVYQTARDLLSAGHELEVVADCVSSRTADNRDLGLERIVQEGGRVTSVEMCLFELLGAARGGAFKAILPIVK